MVRKLVTKAKKWTWSVASWNQEARVLRRPVVGCVVVSAYFGSYWCPKIRNHFKTADTKKPPRGWFFSRTCGPGTPQDTSIKSGVLARLPLQLYTKLYTKIFACPPKVTFTTSRFLHPGIELLLCILSTLKKCWCIGAFSRNYLNIKENIAFSSWCATGFFVVHLVHFVRKKPANA